MFLEASFLIFRLQFFILVLLCIQVYYLSIHFAYHYFLVSKSRLVQVSWCLFIYGICSVNYVNKLEKRLDFSCLFSIIF